MSTGEVMRGQAVTRKGSLTRAEVVRLRSRRLVRLLLLLGLVGIIAIGVGEFVSHAGKHKASKMVRLVIFDAVRAVEHK